MPDDDILRQPGRLVIIVEEDTPYRDAARRGLPSDVAVAPFDFRCAINDAADLEQDVPCPRLAEAVVEGAGAAAIEVGHIINGAAPPARGGRGAKAFRSGESGDLAVCEAKNK